MIESPVGGLGASAKRERWVMGREKIEREKPSCVEDLRI